MKLLQSQFETAFNRPSVSAVRAPGRVNLIGEHTDYNGGFVLPIAIERQTVALFAVRNDRNVAIASNQSPGEKLLIDLDKPIEPGEPKWGNYCRGVLEYLRQREPAGLGGKRLVGMDILFDSDVPLGGGLSSSASLEVATAIAALKAIDSRGSVSDRDLALLCQKAENIFAGAPCGIMDQSVIVMAQAGRALLLDCRDGSTKHIPFDDPTLVLLVADTQVKHAIGDGGYGARRQQCAKAAAALGVEFLREVNDEAVDAAAKAGKIAGKELMRARHVVGEIRRTVDAVGSLRSGDYHAFGRLMYASHDSLRDDYEVSCDELDAIVDAASKLDGVYGARMTGGGFGGCAIMLVEARRAEVIKQAVAEGFAAKFDRRCPIFSTHAAAGAGS